MGFLFRSRRLGFRAWRREDLWDATALWADPKVSEWIGGPFTAEQIRARFEGEMELFERLGLQYWPAFLLATGEHVGCAGLRPKAPGMLELGYHLKPAFWGMGLATEAARAVADYAFCTLGVGMLFAGHHPENRASKRVLEKLGFVGAGEEFYPPSGVMEPIYLLRRELWRNAEI